MNEGSEWDINEIVLELMIVEMGDGNTETIISLYHSAHFVHLIFSIIKFPKLQLLNKME